MCKKSEFIQMIDKYGELDAQKKSIEKELKPLNADIKKEITSRSIAAGKSIEGDTYSIKYTEKKTKNLNEDMLIELLKSTLSEYQLKKVIKKREYVDMEALESLLYHGTISADIVEKCTEVKTVQVISASLKK